MAYTPSVNFVLNQAIPVDLTGSATVDIVPVKYQPLALVGSATLDAVPVNYQQLALTGNGTLSPVFVTYTVASLSGSAAVTLVVPPSTSLYMPTLTCTVDVDGIYQTQSGVFIDMPVLTLETGANFGAVLGEISLNMPTLTLDASLSMLATGVGRSVVVDMPVLTCTVGDPIIIDMPALTVELVERAVAAMDAAYCYHLDGDRPRVTRFTNFNFLRILRIGGKNYGFTRTGRYLIGGDDDNGTAISSSFTLASYRPANGFLARCPWLHYQGDYPLTVSFTIGGMDGTTYTGFTGTRYRENQGRAQLPQGAVSGLWAFKIENTAGNPLHIAWIEPDFIPLNRRV